MTVDQILQDALQLSRDDRAALAYTLIDTLDDETTDENVDQAWADEIERRRTAIRNGETQVIPWDEAVQRLRQELAEHRSP